MPGKRLWAHQFPSKSSGIACNTVRCKGIGFQKADFPGLTGYAINQVS